MATRSGVSSARLRRGRNFPSSALLCILNLFLVIGMNPVLSASKEPGAVCIPGTDSCDTGNSVCRQGRLDELGYRCYCTKGHIKIHSRCRPITDSCVACNDGQCYTEESGTAQCHCTYQNLEVNQATSGCDTADWKVDCGDGSNFDNLKMTVTADGTRATEDVYAVGMCDSDECRMAVTAGNEDRFFLELRLAGRPCMTRIRKIGSDREFSVLFVRSNNKFCINDGTDDVYMARCIWRKAIVDKLIIPDPVFTGGQIYEPEIRFEVLKAGTPVTTVQAGDQIQMKFTITSTSYLLTDSRLIVNTCSMSTLPAFVHGNDNTLVFLQNRCPIVGALSGFVYGKPFSRDEYSVTSEAFTATHFGTGTVYFSCDLTMCTSTNPALCTLPTTCPTTRRKRRNVNDTEEIRTTMMKSKTRPVYTKITVLPENDYPVHTDLKTILTALVGVMTILLSIIISGIAILHVQEMKGKREKEKVAVIHAPISAIHAQKCPETKAQSGGPEGCY